MMARLGVHVGCTQLHGCSMHARSFLHTTAVRNSVAFRWSRSFATSKYTVPMVSSLGRVQGKYGKITWGYLNAAGYCTVGLNGRVWRVHRLVARTFLGRPPSPSHCYVVHKDSNRSNNLLSNLEYMTPSESVLQPQQRFRRRHTLYASSKPVFGRVRGSIEWSLYPSMAEAARQLKLRVAHTRRACQAIPIDIQGFEFRFADSRTGDYDETQPNEEWRIAIHPTSYASLAPFMVSSSGRVSSARSPVTWGHACDYGYRRVQIRTDGSRQSFYVHRLVAAAFLGSPPDESHVQVNHKDRDKSNNHVDNLEFVTCSQNVKHSYSIGSRRTCREARSKPVWAEHVETNERIWYPSGKEAARQLDLNQGSISLCCNGVCGRVGCYSFSFAAPVIAERLPGEEWREVVFDI